MRIKTLLSIAALACSGFAWGQNYPNRPVTIVVPAGAGGGTDILARAMADELGKRLKQTFIVDNKTGASGMIGTQAVARAAPDGYTLLFAYSAPIYYARHMFAKVPYDVSRDLAVVSEVAANNLILVVNNELPVKDMKDFMAWAQQGKGKLSYGSIGIGSAGHLAAAYLNESRGLAQAHVPYKSEAPFAQDLAGGIVPWGMGTLAPMQPHIQSGKVRPIAVLAENRLPALPNVPTIKELGFPDPELRSMTWFTFAAPARTPQPILDLLEKHAREIAHSAEMKARFQVLGLDPIGGSAEEFRRNFEASRPVLERLVKVSGARTE
ncbi:tripartite tricarboxylate transporter substrate binding protein [Pantoea sp. 18069]|uniref:Bug family tripartite tricarboxylate transporter substrate binding protein n=1 Tax=Pantoea sp. 18069 TaxID=2681415 RepID=UPI001356A47F|nr:tripartite tricarboxylate transporter substrate binding protein [Pantoea sp. 18069]